ncbi:LamG-like jellyroll fold domain-containing protein [Pedobacter gandavensis]|uniref:LamG-like jellyroll fold domain-containing protein n=1 Tax=Pedobacter gandavensis TaxID=2679963 RepID=UPI00292F0B1A|nr:LamG-like jellyroll fold domain-containing protein [Pedobacter gandavensis]
MNKIKTYTHKGLVTGLLGSAAMVLLMMLGSCNKDFPNKLKENIKNDTAGVNSKTRKVLYIIVDGLRGRALKEINAPNISQVIKKSIYAYDGLTDVDGTGVSNAGAWTNMLTGVKRGQHGVVSEDFAGNKLSQFPSVITRLKQNLPGLRTASFGASATFGSHLAIDATENKSFEGDDLAVKNAVKAELGRGDAGFVLAQFHSVELAGKASGYESTTADYANAVLKMDTYIGELINALSQRKTFVTENWLVVIASNKGGLIAPDPNSTDITPYADPVRNNFVIFYNPRFNSLFVPKPDSEKIPYSGSSIRYDFTEATRPIATVNSTTAYNFGVYGNYTIEILLKSNTTSEIYPTFLSKREKGFTGPGWNMFLEGGAWTLNTNVSGQMKGRAINDGKWHKLTIVFDGTNKKVRGYTDGKFDNELDMNSSTLDNPAALRLGYLPTDGNQNASVLMTELKIFKAALTATEISAYGCKPDIKSDHPKYSTLIGYWPMQDGLGNVLKEKTGKGLDFRLGGTVPWETFSVVSPALCPDINAKFYTMVPNSVDIPIEIYHWMGVSVPTSWGLDGKSWDPTYSDIKP